MTVMVLMAAGISVVVQNLLMVRITTSVSTVLITLVINSGAGLAILLAVLIARTDSSGIMELIGRFGRGLCCRDFRAHSSFSL